MKTMTQVQVDHGLCKLNGAVQPKKKHQPPELFNGSSAVVNISAIKMVMILAVASSLSFSLGRFCQSRVPSLQRALQQSVDIFPLVSLLGQYQHLVLPDDCQKVDQHDHHMEFDSLSVLSNGAKHLMVDITNIADSEFLSSPERLEEMLLSLFQDNLNDPILSFTQTNNLEHAGGGISFTALFLQSHAFLHAWPSTGVLTLDIYKSRSEAWGFSQSNVMANNIDSEEQKSLISLVPVIQSLFVRKESENDDNEQQQPEPRIYWAIKDRGLDYDNAKSGPSDSVDYRSHYMGSRAYTYKELVASVTTPFQTFEVFEIVNLRDKEQKKDRILFLDHVTQSTRLGLEGYHEALVHPALLTHPNPKRVAIVGGGEGATLREVLKHSTVEKVVMIEIDALMVNASKTALLEWNDCSDLVGSVGSCFDDPRAEVYLEDAVGWFLDRYNKDDISEEEKFDVIIMDALDPSSLIGFSDVLYGNLELTQSMHDSLTDEGILIVQVGDADVPDDTGNKHNAEVGATDKMEQLFQEVGFEYSLDYAEQHCGFLAPWAFLISFLDKEKSLERWYANSATIDLELSKRAVSTISGDFPFKYFDGATMAVYQHPPRADQNVHCRSYPDSPGCHTAEYRTLQPLPRLQSSEMPVLNGTCYSANSFQDSVHSLSIMPSTSKLITSLSDTVVSILWKSIEASIERFGFGHKFFGTTGYILNPSLVKSKVTISPDDDDRNERSASCLEGDIESLPSSFIARNQYLLLAGVSHGGAAAVIGECKPYN